MTIQGIPKAKAFLLKKNKKVNSKVKEAMIKAGAFMDGEVKESIAGRKAEHASVDTGNFLRSVSFKASNDNATIYTDVSYAKFLEYGSSKLAARRHFNNSKDRNKGNIKEIISSKIKEI